MVRTKANHNSRYLLKWLLGAGTFEMLRYLSDKGSSRFRDLNRFFRSTSTLSLRLDQLEEMNLIEREISYPLGRPVLVAYRITQRGREALASIDRLWELNPVIRVKSGAGSYSKGVTISQQPDATASARQYDIRALKNEIFSLVRKYEEIGRAILEKLPCYEGRCPYYSAILRNGVCRYDCAILPLVRDILNISKLLDT